MLNFQNLSEAEDAAATAVYLSKLSGIIRENEETPMHTFLIEHYQHELDLASIRLAGPKATKSQILKTAEVIKAAIEEIEGEVVHSDT